MDLQAFLQSGLLESYVLGQCTEAERNLVSDMLAQYPEVRAEMAQIEQALETYARAHAITPPQWMKGRILDQVVAANDTPFLRPRRNTFLLAAAALTGLLCVALGALYLQNRSRIQELEQTTAACAERATEQEQLQQEIVLLRDTATRRVELRPIDPNSPPNILALVFDNPVKNQTMLHLVDLPALPAGKDYQLWVFAGNNPDPQPMDVFRPETAAGGKSVAFHAEAKAFAVSVERKGGSVTGKPGLVVVVGKV